MDLRRRALLGSIASATAAGLAGCSQGSGTVECEALPEEPAHDGWFRGVSNYDATCDMRDEDSVPVRVGAEGNGAYWAFSQPAIAISPGTEVTWEWTGRGGPHDVEAVDGTFDSGRPVDNASKEFSYTFDAPAVYRYVCTPHRSQGMKGAVFVALE